MPELGFDPFGFDKPEGAQPIEERVNRALDDDEIRIYFEIAKDFEPIEPAIPERSEDGEFERALTKLDFPFLGAFWYW